jgi:nucleotide-binding universal stress UspA family protein
MVRFQKVLCPVDFFNPSRRALDYAVKFAANYDALVHALHVVAPVIPAAYGAPFSVQDLTADLEKEARRLLGKLQAEAAKSGVPVTTEVRLGDIDIEIRHAVESQKADVVVMGTHGRRGFERLVMGSVTERMIRHCPVPLITVGPGRKAGAAPPEIRRILVTTDFSEGTADAMDCALSIAQECQAKVTLLHVVHDIAADISGKYREPLWRGIETELQKLVPEEALDWCDVETRVDAGLPYVFIPRFLQSGKFDLLVMNIHGKSMLDRALLGSTAERTVRAAAEICPVMLIPPRALAKGQSKRSRRGARK